MTERIEGFAPVCFPESRVLILGSFPSVKSRAEGFYYGNPRNRFWRTVCGFFGEEVPADIAGKQDFLRRRKLALWDSVTACTIHASSDASIREAAAADVAGLIRGTEVRTVFCNGKAAFAYLPKEFLPDHVRVKCLPSTSPANPRFSAAAWHTALAEAFEEKENAYIR